MYLIVLTPSRGAGASSRVRVAEVNVDPLWRGRGEVVVVSVGGWVGRVSAADTTLLRQWLLLTFRICNWD